jgi:hypothetical protein
MNQKYIYIDSCGGIANRLIFWAHARIATQEIQFAALLFNFPPFVGQCELPYTINNEIDVSDWRKVGVDNLREFVGDFVLTGLWEFQCSSEELRHQLKTIKFNKNLVNTAMSLTDIGNPVIGVHIRYGDYVIAKPSESRTCFVRASNDYYIKQTESFLVKYPNSNIFLASNGTEDEVAWFVKRYNPLRQVKNNGLLDLITLTKCVAIVGSNSTFTDVAAMIGDVEYTHPPSR